MTPYSQNDEELSPALIRKLNWHILPLVVAGFFMAFLDRVNISFASLTMNQDLGFSATVYGWGAGIFFLSYFLFEVPSNVLLDKVGARVWLARIMISWGVISAAMALVQGPISFFVVRFLLGAAEAGFFPGVILYLTYWYPKAYRARVMAGFLLSIPISVVLGAPLSTWLLSLHGFGGFAGWKILFVVEAIPSLVLGVAYLFLLSDKPRSASWLSDIEKNQIERLLDAEARAMPDSKQHHSFIKGVMNPKVLMLGFLYFCSSIGFWGLGFWLPQVLKQLGLPATSIGWVLTIPYGLAVVAMILWSRHSDKTNERPWHFAVGALVGAIGLAGTGYFLDPQISVVFISLSAIGIYMLLPIFWSYPPAVVSGAAAASGFAVINSIGNLAGFVGPFFIGVIKDATGGYAISFFIMAGFLCVQAISALIMGRKIFGSKHDVQLSTPIPQ